MITVRKLAESFGLTRTTLLYYDRIGLLRPTRRSEAGYRLYDTDCVERLRLIRTYKNAGLSLNEIRDLLADTKGADKGFLRARLDELDEQICQLRIQQRSIVNLLRNVGDADPALAIERGTWVEILRASGMNEQDMQRWHDEFERNAPKAHHSFLRWLGIPEGDVCRIREKSREPSEG